ncbi:MAG: ChbG/HpnK family deacetylase [Fimbriimonadaceae bacterium]|nr:ChbG/HpnK family deacetylase [Fimbriimonadaceae bacterium]
MARLITRADDAGSYRAAIPAMLEGVRAGTLKNLSVMACGLFFREAANDLRGLEGVDIGLHFCLNSEFDAPRWGPISSAPSLTDADGFFLPRPLDLHERGFHLGEVLAELAAQFEAMTDAGLHPAYIDTHMGLDWLAGVRSGIAEFAARKGLLFAPMTPGLDWQPDYAGASASADRLAEALLSAAEAADSEPKLVVTHPAASGPEMAALTHFGSPPGEIEGNREADRRLWTHPRLAAALASGAVEPIRWTEAF